VGSRFTNNDVMIVLERLFVHYGYLIFIPVDNGQDLFLNTFLFCCIKRARKCSNLCYLQELHKNEKYEEFPKAFLGQKILP